AAKALVALPANLSATLSYCYTPGAKRPSDADMDALRAWVKHNDEALALYNASLSKPGVRWPEDNSQTTQPELNTPFNLTRARLFQADLAVQKKQFDEAAASLEESMKLVQLGFDGDPGVFPYLVTARARTLVQNAMVRLAADPGVPLVIQERM